MTSPGLDGPQGPHVVLRSRGGRFGRREGSIPCSNGRPGGTPKLRKSEVLSSDLKRAQPLPEGPRHCFLETAGSRSCVPPPLLQPGPRRAWVSLYLVNLRLKLLHCRGGWPQGVGRTWEWVVGVGLGLVPSSRRTRGAPAQSLMCSHVHHPHGDWAKVLRILSYQKQRQQ